MIQQLRDQYPFATVIATGSRAHSSLLSPHDDLDLIAVASKRDEYRGLLRTAELLREKRLSAGLAAPRVSLRCYLESGLQLSYESDSLRLGAAVHNGRRLWGSRDFDTISCDVSLDAITLANRTKWFYWMTAAAQRRQPPTVVIRKIQKDAMDLAAPFQRSATETLVTFRNYHTTFGASDNMVSSLIDGISSNSRYTTQRAVEMFLEYAFDEAKNKNCHYREVWETANFDCCKEILGQLGVA